jgi:hypothetical protein
MSRPFALFPFLLLMVPAARAQAPPRAHPPVAIAFELGQVIAFEDAEMQVGIRISPPKSGVGGVDAAFATFPAAIADGRVVVMFDVDATFGWPLGGDDVGVFPRGGISALAGGGAAVGYNAGIGILARVSPGFGLRLDYTHRRFLTGADTLPFSSVTAGLVLLLH